jgi:WbqC-like protein family
MTLVAIHQPNFFPWLGYFDKIAQADVFVFLDSAQFPKTGGTWSNRVRLLQGQSSEWHTMPIVRSYHGVRRIAEMQISDATGWRAKFLRSVEMTYGRAPHFGEVFALLEELVNYPTENLSDFNISAVTRLATSLSLDTSRLVVGSSLHCSGAATDLLIAMVKAVGGDAYLAGGGAAAYQEDEKFELSDLRLVYQHFDHPIYRQLDRPEFVAGLSVLDALFNLGFDATRHLLSDGEAAR